MGSFLPLPFAAIHTDNGTEFSDPGMIENYRPDPEHNPTKLLPRGAKVWFCDPYCSSQKPHIENFHLMLKRRQTLGDATALWDAAACRV